MQGNSSHSSKGMRHRNGTVWVSLESITKLKNPVTKAAYHTILFIGNV